MDANLPRFHFGIEDRLLPRNCAAISLHFVWRRVPANAHARHSYAAFPSGSTAVVCAEGSIVFGIHGWSSDGFVNPQRLHTNTPSNSRNIAW
jgi:hypothetical protein